MAAASSAGFFESAGFSDLFSGFASLLVCRAALGFAEAGGIPAAGKASAVYLEPKHRALGSAVSQIGLTIGLVLAPVLTVWLEPRYGWRAVFVVAGAAFGMDEDDEGRHNA